MSDLSRRISVEALKKTPEFQRLTAKQQLFVETYCGGGMIDGIYNAVGATMVAYRCKSMEVARIMSYSLLANIRIVEVLARHFNAEPIEDFLVELNRAIHNKKLTLAQLQALKLKADVLGFTVRLPGASKNATDVIPVDVLEASKEARKQKRKNTPKVPKPPKLAYDPN